MPTVAEHRATCAEACLAAAETELETTTLARAYVHSLRGVALDPAHVPAHEPAAMQAAAEQLADALDCIFSTF